MKNIVRYLYAAGMVVAIWVVFHVLLGHGIVWVILLTIASLAIYYFFNSTSDDKISELLFMFDDDKKDFKIVCLFGGLVIVLMYFAWWILRDVLYWGWFWVVLIECLFAAGFAIVLYDVFFSLSLDPILITDKWDKWIKIKDVFLYYRRNEYEQVIKCFRNEYSLYKTCEENKKLANALVQSYWNVGDAEKALSYIMRYEKFFTVHSWNTIKGLDYKEKGQYEKALDCFKSAENAAEIAAVQSILDRIAEEKALKEKQIAEEKALKEKQIAEAKARAARESNMCKSAFEKKDYRTIVQLFKNNDDLAKDENVVSCYIRALWALGKTSDTLSCIDKYSSIFDTTQWNDIRAEHQYNNGNYWEASEYYTSANMKSEAGKMVQLAISEDKKETERLQYYYNQGSYGTVVKRFETNKYQRKYKTAVNIYIRALFELNNRPRLMELIPQYNAQFGTKEWNVYLGHYYRQEEEYDKALEMYQSAGCKDESDDIKRIIQELEQQKVEYLQTFDAKQYGQVIKTFEATPKWNTDIKLVDAYVRSNWELDKSAKTIDILTEYAKKFNTDQWDEIRGIYCESQEDYVQAHQWYKTAGRSVDCDRVEGKEIDRLLAQIKSLRSNGCFGQIIELLESAEFWNKSKDIIDIYLEAVYKQEGPSERLCDLATQFDGQHHCNQWQKYKAMYYEKEGLFAKAAECYKIAGMNDKFIAMQKAEEEERVRRAEEERRRREEEERRRREEEERRRREEEERRRREEEERRRREEEERKQKEQKIQRMNEAMENEDWYDAIHLFENDSFYREQNEYKEYYVAALIQHGDYDEAYEAAQQYRGALDDDVFYVCKGYHYLSNGDFEEAEKYFRWGHADRLVQQVKEIREAQDDDSWSYGSSSRSEHTIYTGKRGGRYYINDSGQKVYVDRDE